MTLVARRLKGAHREAADAERHSGREPSRAVAL
jgi:hypothetical protein